MLSSFRRRMWPLLGTTTLECLRVIDWAQQRFDIAGPVVAGGVSMGGDVAVALAGIDERVTRVSALAATPEWSRPQMCALDDPSQLIDQGAADAYAQWFYDDLNPATHLERYRRNVAISFQSGGSDHHVPADDALAFRTSCADRFPDAADRIAVRVHPGAGHLDIDDRFLDNVIDWLIRA